MAVSVHKFSVIIWHHDVISLESLETVVMQGCLIAELISSPPETNRGNCLPLVSYLVTNGTVHSFLSKCYDRFRTFLWLICWLFYESFKAKNDKLFNFWVKFICLYRDNICFVIVHGIIATFHNMHWQETVPINGCNLQQDFDFSILFSLFFRKQLVLQVYFVKIRKIR